MEAAHVVFFVRAVKAVVFKAKSNEHGIDVEDFLEMTRDWDGPAGANEGGGFWKLL